MTDKKMKKVGRGRRRTLKIIAAAGGSLAAIRMGPAFGAAPQAYVWQGTALGARASLTLYHVSNAEGRRLVNAVGEELQRLESLFSLYRTDSVDDAFAYLTEQLAGYALEHPGGQL